MGANNRIENLTEEGCRSLVMILQGPVRDTIWARGLADLKIPDDILTLARVG
jgi:hypothetical protein